MIEVLSSSVAPIQLKLLLKEEAEMSDDMRAFAVDTLSRFLREYLPDGWRGDSSAEYARVQAFSDWMTLVGEYYEEQCHRVWQWFNSSDVRDGWLPTGPDDPLLHRAFNAAWDENTVK